MLYNLNRLSIQFEILISSLDEDPLAFERVISLNIRRALQRRLRHEIEQLHGFELSEAEIEALASDAPEE